MTKIILFIFTFFIVKQIVIRNLSKKYEKELKNKR